MPPKKPAPKRTTKSTTWGGARSTKKSFSRTVGAPTIDTTQQHLLIVESPAKAKTIKKYLWEGYEVVASMGHVVDLPSKGMGIDIKNWFTPSYEVDAGKKAVVSSLKKAAKTMKVWLATDEDREGEAIAWHLARELWLDVTKTPRIVFHEITQSALKEAIAHPRVLDLALVDAQQARRVLDRLVGYELSPVLWKKIKTWLSAGRVQSVAVKLVVDRERDIMAHSAEHKFTLEGQFVTTDALPFRAIYTKQLTTKDAAKKLLTSWAAEQFKIADVVKKPWTKNPSAPFTTSTLQQEASRRLGYSVGRTMQLAQRLYEAGHITYMRTDSNTLSGQAMANIGKLITDRFGKQYHQARKFATKSASAQEAHEAIRPTNPSIERAGDEEQQKKLYHLIRQKTVASQMSPAQIEKTEITLAPVSSPKDLFSAKGEVVLFPGFLSVYGVTVDDDDSAEQSGENQHMPAVKSGDLLSYIQISAVESLTKPAARFTEAMLVKMMEENGIWRPSTYAPTISTIQQRGYVERRDSDGQKMDLRELLLKKTTVTEKQVQKFVGGYKGRLVPTDMGMVVTDFLIEHFPAIIDETFTAQVEQEFDHIAEKKLQRQAMMKKFYDPFHRTVVQVTETAERASGERVLGTDPKTGKVVKVRIGRFGPLVQIGESDDDDKKFASIPPGYHIETITLEQAFEAFLLPRTLGEWQEKEVKANTGRFGPYVQRGSTFASLPKWGDPMSITYDEAVLLIEAKAQKDLENTIWTFEVAGKDAVVKKGRRGYFISYKRKKYALPKGIDVKAIDADLVKTVIGADANEKSPKTATKKPAKKAKKKAIAKKKK
jgi:DNA topoisomerase-1